MFRLSLARIWTPGFYNRIARFYDRIAGLIAPEGKVAQRKMVDDLMDGTLLDVGCGTGTLLAMAGKRGLKTFGIDTSSGMLVQARDKASDTRLLQASFYQLPFPDNCFDNVVESNALSGVDITTERALEEMLRVCKQGGQVRLADYAKPPKRSWRHKLFEWAGIAVGDYPYDYKQLFGKLGYQAQIEVIGGHGMYQLITIKKTR
jgi:ubiquinone/menaquinone biosynthesis C-methylase UbiE